jgi:hypothetical protein
LHRERSLAAAGLCGAELFCTVAFIESEYTVKIRAAPLNYLVQSCLFSVSANLSTKIKVNRNSRSPNR